MFEKYDILITVVILCRRFRS